jgi:hypothetical protein
MNCVVTSLVELGTIELRNNLAVPIVLKSHDLSKAKFSTLGDHIIDTWVVHVLKVFPINVLHDHNRSFRLP